LKQILNKFLLQSRVVSRAGFRHKFVKMFRPISGLHTKLFHNIQSDDFFSFVTYICCACRGWSDYNFSLANSICKHSCVILSARISLTFFLKATAVVRKLPSDGVARRNQSLTRFLACFNKRWPINPLFVPIALS